MPRFVAWIGKNADGLIALVLAACIAILALTDVVGTNEVNSAVLLILAVLATTLLRDRVRSGFIERDVRKVYDRVKTLDTKATRIQQVLEHASTLRVLHGDAISEALAAGLLIERGSVYYDRYATELGTSFDQSRPLPIEQAAKMIPLGEEPSVEQAQKLFVALTVPLPSSFDDAAVMDIIQKAINSKDPYPRL